MDFVQQYRSSRYSLNSFKRSALHDLSIGQGARAAIVQGSSKDGFDVDEEAPYNKVSLYCACDLCICDSIKLDCFASIKPSKETQK